MRYDHNTSGWTIDMLHRMSDDLMLLNRKYQFNPADNNFVGHEITLQLI
jgi:hypothetical protein